jgi:RimJ/RimL family protein N-acetyltransferase
LNNVNIKTARLHLKKLRLEDAQTVFLYRSSDAVSKYQSFHPKVLEEVIRFIADNTKYIDIDNTWFQLGIYLSSGKLIGDFGIHFINKHDGICEIGYSIGVEYQRQGYGKEAAFGVLHYLFETMKKNKVIASIDPKNEASKRMLEALGYKITEQTTDNIEYELFKNNFQLIKLST